MENKVFLKPENTTHRLFNNCKGKWNITNDKLGRFKQVINFDLTCDLLTLPASWKTKYYAQCYGWGVA